MDIKYAEDINPNKDIEAATFDLQSLVRYSLRQRFLEMAGKNPYSGTVTYKVKTERRRANRVARASRKTNRGK